MPDILRLLHKFGTEPMRHGIKERHSAETKYLPVSSHLLFAGDLSIT